MRKPRQDLLLYPVDDENSQKNFTNIDKFLADTGLTTRGKETELLALVAGDNEVRVPLNGPVGRITIYLDAAVTIYDKGLNSRNYWVVNCSAPCNARFYFI